MGRIRTRGNLPFPGVVHSSMRGGTDKTAINFSTMWEYRSSRIRQKPYKFFDCQFKKEIKIPVNTCIDQKSHLAQRQGCRRVKTCIRFTQAGYEVAIKFRDLHTQLLRLTPQSVCRFLYPQPVVQRGSFKALRMLDGSWLAEKKV